MMLFFLVLNYLLRFGFGMQLNMYNTDQTLDIDNLQVNCLHYYNRQGIDKMQKVEYCLGSMQNNNDYLLNDNSLDLHGPSLTFDELRQLNVTTNDLLLWSSTIDLAEKYQDYLDHQENSSLSREIFFNCTKPWFGPRCQFSFVSNEASSFLDFMRETYSKRYTYGSLYSITNLTCYTHLTCNRGGSNLCLDWREVCNGRIDCLNEAIDEAQCFELEVNECHDDEYRCHNGQCIPKEFLEEATAECLDMSDTWDMLLISPMLPDIFNYEEHLCHSNSEQFVCGDGQCVADFNQCNNKRHVLLIQSISNQGNLSYTCWMIMVCLTKILEHINGTSCHQLITSSNMNTYLAGCNGVIQFPTVPVLFGHIRFLYYTKERNDFDIDFVLIPDYICYDNKLCDFLIPTHHYGNSSCQPYHQFHFNSNMKYPTWTSFIRLIEVYFRKCSVRYNKNNMENSISYPSLYCCQNSSKCISKHRILDNISDCYLNDDEEQYELSCSINDVLRSKCAYDNRCYSFIILKDICPQSHLQTFDKIEFRKFCDRHVQMFSLIINGTNHTDENDCEYWLCNNFYTRCDGFWSCTDGEDEENCTTQQMCPAHTLLCVNPYNSTVTCLSANQVNDGKIDCLGSMDEREHCRNRLYANERDIHFRCWNDDTCIAKDFFCDEYQDCPDNDDEEFCQNYDPHGLCYNMDYFNLSDVENAICHTIDMEQIYFTLKTSRIYPAVDNQTNKQVIQQSQQHSIPRLVTNELADSAIWLWYCNHGIYVHHWLGNNQLTYKCFCPPSYYGDRCQYQNQRISLTVQVRAMNITTVYAVYITLIDDDDYRQNIISYQQYTLSTSISCIHNLNGYLTYDKRPKSSLTNYAIRIHIYDKISRTCTASWHYTVPFSFLPVNRMAVVLYVPAQQVLSVSSCSLKCQNGTCKKYLNKDKYYCQCDVGWSGVECNISIRCHDCSSDSICVGMIQNRSICVCPLHKGGPRCLLSLSCNDIPCENNSTCLAVDDGIHEYSSICICPNGFYGLWCDKSMYTMTISFENIKIPSILLIYIYEFDLDSDTELVQNTVIARKLTIFQRMISIMTKISLHIVFVKTDDNYYLAVDQHTTQSHIFTSINSSRQCTRLNQLLTIEQQTWPEIRRIKYYHQLCQTHFDTLCFIDDSYACLCTLEHEANCIRFNSTPPTCRDQTYCKNQGRCFQDHIQCPTAFMCNCTDCYFGDRCQYYAKGIGLTLDDILRYELRPNMTLSHQSAIIQWSCALIMIIYVASLINSILSLITFSTKQSRETGCGLYLIASSITSLLTVSIFTAKFWFLLITQMNPSVSPAILRIGCILFELLLKVCLYMNNWLNACVALERLMIIYKGVNFNKRLSKRFARWTIFILPLVIIISLIHEPLNRDLFDDKDEQRFWCVFHYSSSVEIYNTIIICIHFIGPFCINLISAFFIIFFTTRQRGIVQRRITYYERLRNQFKEHKNLIISPIILIVLSTPGLIIALSSDCIKVSYNTWLYLWGYLISFLPSMSIFIIFVIPSDYYKKQFKEAIKYHRRRWQTRVSP